MSDQKRRKIVEVVGQSVKGWKNDFDLILRISGGDEFTGILLSKFSITKGGENVYLCDSKEPGDAIDPEMASLVGAKINDALANEAGDLVLSFEDGRQLVAPFSDDIEAWEFRWLNKKQIVSLPGGGFAEF